MIKSIRKKIYNNPRLIASLFNLYRPFRGAGIKIKNIAPDFRQVQVEMPLTRGNKNIMGTHFGGSLYAMADPFYMFMLMRNLGNRYHVWDQVAHIEFRRPGNSLVKADFRIDQSDLDQIITQAASGEKVLYSFFCDILKPNGAVVARVEKVLYIRLKKQFRPEN